MPIISENFKIRPRHNWYSKIIRKIYKIRVEMTKPRNPIPDKDIRQKAEKEGRLVIQIPFGGLGDHLSYSSLPELLLKQKNIKTFISNKSVFDSKAILDFVWKLNPYVEFTDEYGWFTYELLESNFTTMDKYFQNLFGLEVNGLPKVYYKPKLIEELKNSVIVNPSFGPSGKANGYFDPQFQQKYIDYLKGIEDNFVMLASTHLRKKNCLEKKVKKYLSPAVYKIETIEDLANALFSAKQRYLMYTGSASLAAALRLPSTVLCNKKSCPFFQYSTNNYIDLMKTNLPPVSSSSRHPENRSCAV
ncbi:MAG: hypothetical protein WC374_00185 [Phycisphaerae bacterium]|jgi:hypothetical protein